MPTGFPRVPAAKSINFRFAEFELRPEALELTRNGVRIRLQIQPFRVLELLLERAGEVVTREEFRARVWPSNVYVDFDHGLNNAIARLRESLGDSADNPRYIETLHRIGYRFIYPTEPIEAAASLAPEVSAQTALPETTDTVLHDAPQAGVPAPVTARSRLSPRLLAIGAMLFAIALFGTLMAIDRGANHRGVTPIRSVAVLPFRDLSEDGREDYFAAGMTEALITRLAQNQSLRVVSRRAAAIHQDAEEPIAEIARDLQVDGVIDGSIVRQGNNVRIDVQLVRATDESHAWAQSYQRSMQDVFQLQRELADDISSEIDAGVGGKPKEQVSVARSDNIEAYELYLQGRHLWNQRNRQSVSNSLGYFQRAIQLDPDFAAAYAGLAQAYVTLGGRTLVKSMPAEDVRPAAMAAARRAVELDADLAEAHWAMAGVLSHLFPQTMQRDAEIEREYLLALRLNPASADTRHGYGNFLSNRRRSDEAIAQYRDALRLDPLSPNIVGRLGMELAANGQVEEGMDFMRRAVELEPWQFNAHVRLGWAYALFGQYEEATRAFAVAEQVSPGGPQTLAGRSFVAARSGDKAQATAVLAELQAQAEAVDAPFLVAIVYVGLQDRDGALEWLERAASSSNMLRRGGLYGLDNPIYDWLRNDPRFEQIRRVAEGPGRDPVS
jgi:TolB-like protein/DNA-binding winged helix-turn-helix (wHTH) protein/thioredoxin-like negative regulator of GroEL